MKYRTLKQLEELYSVLKETSGQSNVFLGCMYEAGKYFGASDYRLIGYWFDKNGNSTHLYCRVIV